MAHTTTTMKEKLIANLALANETLDKAYDARDFETCGIIQNVIDKIRADLRDIENEGL